MNKGATLKNVYRREILGIFISAILIFIFLSLVTYTPGDPSFFYTRTVENYKNLVGQWGAFTASLLYFIFGVGVFPLFFMIVLWIINLFHKGTIKSLYLKSVGYIFLSLFLDLLFYITKITVIPAHPDMGSISMTSGLIGWFASYVSKIKVGQVGLYLLLFITGSFALLFAFNIHISAVLVFLWRKTNAFLDWLKKYGETLKYRRKEPQVISNYNNSAPVKEGLSNVKADIVDTSPPKALKKELKKPQYRPAEAHIESEEKKAEKIEVDTQLPEMTAKSEQPSRPKPEKGLRNGKDKYKLPVLDLLAEPEKLEITDSLLSEIEHDKQVIEDTLKQFNAPATVIGKPMVGPTLTTYELKLEPGVRVSAIKSLEDNISIALGQKVRVVYPIPGKTSVGIERPNIVRKNVVLKEVIQNSDFYSERYGIPIALGMDMGGRSVIADLTQMPHVLIAGATGSGKSVCINSFILSFLYRFSPKELRLILVDPKRVELIQYKDIPHLIENIISEPKIAVNALVWAVEEMEKRFSKLAEMAVRDIHGYNLKAKKERAELLEKRKRREISQEEFEERIAGISEGMPYIVIIIDELADLMIVARNDIEEKIVRLAQKARAVGIHVVLATQRPSTDIITGLIKANLPSRIAFQVASMIDSRTILDSPGAEQLIGKGDMLYLPGDPNNMKRIQGTYVSLEEVQKVVNFIKNQNYSFEDNISLSPKINAQSEGGNAFANPIYDYDPLFKDAVKLVILHKQASVSFLQRKLVIGYQRAARIMDQMFEAGIIGPQEGNKPREILVDEAYLQTLENV